MTALAASEPVEQRGPITAESKPKRVRTGCLTCRERHLKCDEAYTSDNQQCQNCRKSSRVCKRGIRLNFIDTTVKDPAIIPPTADWQVKFLDESRDIASEYKGGLGRYAHVDQTKTPPRDAPLQYAVRTIAEEHSLPPIQSSVTYSDNGLSVKNEDSRSRRASQHHSHAGSESALTAPPSTTSYSNTEAPSPTVETRRYLESAEEVLFMQVFVEEVGLWMDSMDSQKHFSRILPFHALSEPMLLNAFLACGARHLTLVNPIYHEDKALFYYDTATTQLLRQLQNPDRDTVCCATTAVILNVYEIMSERAMQRMNHIAGARALIKECGWNARSTGVGAACFWLNVGMELLSCLHFNWQVAWEPDQWGLDMNMQAETQSGHEEIWVHRVLYIVGKIANFRASIPRVQEASPHDEQLRRHARYSDWKRLKELCDSWDLNIPRTMQPIGYLHPDQTSSKSAFPEVWLIKRATIVGRLFYHTAMCLLAQINPLMSKDAYEMSKMQMHHARLICGIVVHVKDRGVASVALRSLAIAAECLISRREQDEVLETFEKIRKETGWKVQFIGKELKSKWGWPGDEVSQPPQVPRTTLGQFYPSTSQATTSTPVPPPTTKPALQSGILNPLLARADFSLPNHPYQTHYQPPNAQPQNHFPLPPHQSHYHFPPPYA
ncbi:related to regulatory protein for the arginine catabolic pathway [Rhynchosporium graminicola]|uniref:Related to regulatory protein for the arginine catabolic pathway n=1 Tax=Rhynchosporium graminicola TaxID=2792576 RepID=A0A1E1JRL6_9HELO|nr:related to regulatory protein for the arginine catabolic pathway [Rhynchosporium commune]